MRVFFHLITDSGKRKLETYFFAAMCSFSRDFSIILGTWRFHAETPRLQVIPGELATLYGPSVYQPPKRWTTQGQFIF